MATIEAITECINEIKTRGLKTDGEPSYINLALFRIERLVSQSDLAAMSVSEQRRHEQEDKMLRSVYTDDQSYPPCLRRGD